MHKVVLQKKHSKQLTFQVWIDITHFARFCNGQKHRDTYYIHTPPHTPIHTFWCLLLSGLEPNCDSHDDCVVFHEVKLRLHSNKWSIIRMAQINCSHSCCKYFLKKLKCPSHFRTFNSINKVVVFKNKLKEKDHNNREMWKNVSNEKVSLVIGYFMEIIVHNAKKITNH